MNWRTQVSCLILSTAVVSAHPGEHVPAAAVIASDEAVTTGSGGHLYRTVPGWGGLPEGKNIGPTHGGIVVDKVGKVYVSTDAGHGIVVFNADGSFDKFIATECSGTHALAIHEDNGTEYLYGAHLKGERIVKLTLDGEVVLTIPNEETGEIPGGFGGLTSIAVAPSGEIFASCGYGSNKVHKFDAAGKLLKSVGEKGSGNEGGLRFHTCHGLLVDERDEGGPKLLVMDRENRRLVHLTLDLDWVGVHTTDLRRPCAASIHGDICAVAELEGRVALVGADGKVVAVLGDNPERGQWANFGVPATEMKPGVFTAPHGVSFDGVGSLYVQDWNQTGRVTKLERVDVEQ